MKRGEIYYIEKAVQTGSEQSAGRPAVIVSNDRCNLFSEVVEIVYLTTAPKVDLPTHVTIRSSRKPSTALCEQVTSIATARIGGYIGVCTSAEMDAIDQALAISLDIPEWGPAPEPKQKPAESNTALKLELEDCKRKLASTIIERDTWERMYNTLIDKVLK